MRSFKAFLIGMIVTLGCLSSAIIVLEYAFERIRFTLNGRSKSKSKQDVTTRQSLPSSSRRTYLSEEIKFDGAMGFESITMNASSSSGFQTGTGSISHSKIRLQPKVATVAQGTKPTFILHIGPYKTGTTFLQSMLCFNQKMMVPILDQDNLLYLGTCPRKPCGPSTPKPTFICHYGQCGSLFRTSNDESNSPLSQLSPDIIWFTHHALECGSNAMVIYEGLHNIPLEYLEGLHALLLPNWNVQILITYRPLYQWLLSLFNQLYKPGAYRKKEFLLWPNATNRKGILGKEIPPRLVR